jgi:cytosine/adenosine deaminase-related metal-dependent hydrolase
MADLPCRSLRARYVFTGLGPPIAGGTVTLCGPRIVAVGRQARGELLDLGNTAILPGLVNAHTHLELSDLDAPLGTPGMGLIDWIGLVIAHRMRRPPVVDGLEGNRRGTVPIFVAGRHKNGTVPFRLPVTAGIAESRRFGTTSLGEIAQPGWSAEPFLAGRLDATVFLELIAPTAARVDPAIELARGHLRTRHAPRDARPHAPRDARPHAEREEYIAGLAPHAPYSMHTQLLRQAVRLATAAQCPIAFHLAESREELELLATGQGPFQEMLTKIGAWEGSPLSGRRRPLDYLEELAAAPRTLVIHGNYLDDDEIHFLARRADRMSLVYCPRTHAFFRHDPYPLARLLACGVTMALGTDSRASSPDLSILAEMRFLARQHPEIARPTILRLGTLGGAQALGVARSVGTLEPGKLAHLAIVALADRDAADPYDLLFDSDAPVIARWWRGEPDADVPGFVSNEK